MAYRKYTEEAMIDALERGQGFLSKAAESLQCSRGTVENYIHKYQAVGEAYREIIERRHDVVESKLLTAVNEGNVTAMIWYMKTQMRHRGYVEKIEVTWREALQQKGIDPDVVFRTLVDNAKSVIKSESGRPAIPTV